MEREREKRRVMSDIEGNLSGSKRGGLVKEKEEAKGKRLDNWKDERQKVNSYELVLAFTSSLSFRFDFYSFVFVYLNQRKIKRKKNIKNRKQK